MTFKLYIGANNKNGKLEKAKARLIIANEFKAFTAYEVNGYWENKPERTLLVEIATTEKNKVIALAKRLASELNQQAIGLVKTSETMQFIA